MCVCICLCLCEERETERETIFFVTLIVALFVCFFSVSVIIIDLSVLTVYATGTPVLQVRVRLYNAVSSGVSKSAYTMGILFLQV